MQTRRVIALTGVAATLVLLLFASSGRAADPASGKAVDCKGAKTQGWAAWNNVMPPPPDDFHLVGSVQVGNPGVKATLRPRAPQGINPAILLIDLSLEQQPGIWPQVVVWAEARYDESPSKQHYKQVQVFCGKEKIQEIEVKDVQ